MSLRVLADAKSVARNRHGQFRQRFLGGAGNRVAGGDVEITLVTDTVGAEALNR